MKRVIALVSIAVAPLALAAGFALAQTGDAVPDGNGHPNVGALLMPGPTAASASSAAARSSRRASS
jgi:hypothetical protein